MNKKVLKALKSAKAALESCDGNYCRNENSDSIWYQSYNDSLVDKALDDVKDAMVDLVIRK